MVEVDPTRIERRIAAGFCQHLAQTLDEALAAAGRPAARATVSVGLVGNAAEIYPELVTPRDHARRGDRPDFGP